MNEKEKKYLRICVAIFSVLILWGYVAPVLISSAFDAGVVIGVAVFIGTPILVYRILRPLWVKKNSNSK